MSLTIPQAIAQQVTQGKFDFSYHHNCLQINGKHYNFNFDQPTGKYHVSRADGRVPLFSLSRWLGRDTAALIQKEFNRNLHVYKAIPIHQTQIHIQLSDMPRNNPIPIPPADPLSFPKEETEYMTKEEFLWEKELLDAQYPRPDMTFEEKIAYLSQFGTTTYYDV